MESPELASNLKQSYEDPKQEIEVIEATQPTDLQIDPALKPKISLTSSKLTCFLHFASTLLSLTNLLLDILYTSSTIFQVQSVYILSLCLVLLRLLLSLAMGQYFYYKHVTKYKFGIRQADGDDEVDERGRATEKQDEQFVTRGKWLYAAMPLMYYFGMFRLLFVLEF